MNLSYSLRRIHDETKDSAGARLFKSWERTLAAMARRGFNDYEIHAVALTPSVLNAAAWNRPNGAPFTSLADYVGDMTQGELNRLIMKHFAESDGLELNDEGVPCKRGRPVLGDGKTTILVPVGTPPCCDPTTETYACM